MNTEQIRLARIRRELRAYDSQELRPYGARWDPQQARIQYSIGRSHDWTRLRARALSYSLATQRVRFATMMFPN